MTYIILCRQCTIGTQQQVRSCHVKEPIEVNEKARKDAEQRGLLREYHRKGRFEDFEILIHQLVSEQASLTRDLYSSWIQSRLHVKDLAKAVDILDKCKARDPNFLLPTDIVIQAISLLIDDGKYNETLQFIAKNKRTNESHQDHAHVQVQDSVYNLLKRLAIHGKTVEVVQLFESLRDNGFLQVSRQTLSPLIEAHLVHGDMKKAVEMFTFFSKEYKLTVYESGLYGRLIAAKDWETLDNVVDISSAVHGRPNSLIKLAFILCEYNQVERARNIFDTPELFVNEGQMKDECSRYIRWKSVDCLTNLAKATISSQDVSRGPIFESLLELFIRNDESDKALQLLKQQQDEDEIPSEEFLVNLGYYLRSKNIDVPFEIPDCKEKLWEVNKIEEDSDITVHEAKRELIELLKSRNSTEIRKAYRKLREPELAAAMKKLSNGNRDLIPLFNALADGGDVDAVQKVNSLLPEANQNGFWYTDSLARAYGKSQRGEQWINEWNIKLDQTSTTEALQALNNSFPAAGFYSLLEHNPALLDQCKQSYLPVYIKT